VLLVWYLMPLVLELPASLKKTVFAVTCINAIICTTLGLVIGVAVVRSNLLYRGKALPADVPLVDKLEAVRFIAVDWKARSASSTIPVDYDLGAGHWDWITDFGTRYEKWYPAPYTIGRGFDYLFLREYGLHNLQEGVQQRTFGDGRYLITYAFQRRPVPAGHPSHNQLFGRLRVTVIEDR
jgi:hypothetical protein